MKNSKHYPETDAPIKMEEIRADKYANDWRHCEEDELGSKEDDQYTYDYFQTKKRLA